MSKIDDLRRQREAQYAQQQRQREAQKKKAPADREAVPAKRPSLQVVPPLVEGEVAVEPVAPANDVRPPPAKPARQLAREGRGARAGAEVEGKCAVCGKVKPVQNGVVASHQKGLGKVCAGSRKPPA